MFSRNIMEHRQKKWMVGFIRGLTAIWPYSVCAFTHHSNDMPVVCGSQWHPSSPPPLWWPHHLAIGLADGIPPGNGTWVSGCLGNTFLYSISRCHMMSWFLFLVLFSCLRSSSSSSESSSSASESSPSSMSSDFFSASDYLAAAVLVIVGFSLPLWLLLLSSPSLLLLLLSLLDVALVLVLRRLLQLLSFAWSLSWWYKLQDRDKNNSAASAMASQQS